MVVHAQLILNQFKYFPSKAVKESAFAASLKEKLQTRRHSKLYSTPKKAAARIKSVNRNPMKDRAAGANRTKPMTATATAMVKSIWQAYFKTPGQMKAGTRPPLFAQRPVSVWGMKL